MIEQMLFNKVSRRGGVIQDVVKIRLTITKYNAPLSAVDCLKFLDTTGFDSASIVGNIATALDVYPAGYSIYGPIDGVFPFDVWAPGNIGHSWTPHAPNITWWQIDFAHSVELAEVWMAIRVDGGGRNIEDFYLEAWTTDSSAPIELVNITGKIDWGSIPGSSNSQLQLIYKA